MALPEPVWSGGDIKVAEDEIRYPSSRSWGTWRKDPTTMAVLRAVISCLDRLRHGESYFRVDIVDALAQKICGFPSFLFIGSGGSALLNYFQDPSYLSTN